MNRPIENPDLQLKLKIQFYSDVTTVGNDLHQQVGPILHYCCLLSSVSVNHFDISLLINVGLPNSNQIATEVPHRVDPCRQAHMWLELPPRGQIVDQQWRKFVGPECFYTRFNSVKPSPA